MEIFKIQLFALLKYPFKHIVLSRSIEIFSHDAVQCAINEVTVTLARKSFRLLILFEILDFTEILVRRLEM